MTSIKRIIRIDKIEGYKISCLFNDNALKVIDFQELFNLWNVKKGDFGYPLTQSIEAFQAVQVIDGTLGKTKKIIYPSESFFFLYVSLNFPYVAQLCASNLAKHIKKITSSFGVDYFLPLPLTWENIKIESTDENGKPVTHHYDLDPIVLYEAAQP